ncbi:hypothetical protein D3C71_1460850 [compost metagenome]
MGLGADIGRYRMLAGDGLDHQALVAQEHRQHRSRGKLALQLAQHIGGVAAQQVQWMVQRQRRHRRHARAMPARRVAIGAAHLLEQLQLPVRGTRGQLRGLGDLHQRQGPGSQQQTVQDCQATRERAGVLDGRGGLGRQGLAARWHGGIRSGAGTGRQR